MNPDVQSLTLMELLAGYGSILDELRRRKIVRSSNNPLSDYAEVLFCKAFGWTQAKSSASGHDAIDATGLRYQIKGRRLTLHSASRQMSAIRSLDATPFDHLAIGQSLAQARGLLKQARHQAGRSAVEQSGHCRVGHVRPVGGGSRRPAQDDRRRHGLDRFRRRRSNDAGLGG